MRNWPLECEQELETSGGRRPTLQNLPMARSSGDSGGFRGSNLQALLNDLLKAEPISRYRQRNYITKNAGVYLYSERDRRGLVHLYVGESGNGIRGRYGQENNLLTPRREEGPRWREGTSLPAATQVTNAAMDGLQKRGVCVPRDRTAFFRDDPEAYKEWCRQPRRFRAAEFRWLEILGGTEERKCVEAYAIHELRRQGHELYSRTI